MKLIPILFFTLIFQGVAIAQESTPALYLINFKDKGKTKTLYSSPEQFLSQKAIERRVRQNIPIELSDLPVNDSYVKAVSGTGARVVCRSRWFNYIVVESDNQDQNIFETLPFVDQVRGLNNHKFTQLESQPSKAFFRNETVGPVSGSNEKSTSANLYNYGSAANQINMIKGEFLHNKGYCGQGMTIAVLDAGFNSADIMPAFDSLRSNNQIMGVHNFVEPGGNVYDLNISAHGTMVLSTMGANLQGDMVGTAPKADYWLLRSEDANAEYIMEEYYWVSAAEFADSVGADVINSSLGYTVFDDPQSNHTYADMDGNTTYITIGADKAAEKGILVVNSAGNSGADPWLYIGAPADGDSVFSIGAVDGFGNYAYFSSKGPTFDGRIKPTIAAQGMNSAVYSPWGLAFGSGTSFSSPIIAGMSTCLWQAAPSLNNMQVIEALKTTASMANNPDTLLGWGIPDYSSAYGVLGSAHLKEFNILSKLNVFPNPFSSGFKAEFDREIVGNISLDLFNLEGQMIYHYETAKTTPGNCIQLSALGSIPSGLYFLMIRTANAVYSSRVAKL